MNTTHRQAILGIGAALACAALLAAGCGKSGAAGQHFGEPFTAAAQATIGELLATPDAFARKPVRVTGTIVRQCPASGCWFLLSDGQGHELKAELGDYLPKLPQNIGHSAEVEGELIRAGDAHAFIGTRVTFRKKSTP
jgi:hypothetical protein